MVKIAGILKTTLADYPGKVALTVFLAGCNFRCPFCHNPELVLPEHVAKIELTSEDEFFKILDVRKKYSDAVCITGGEPTLYADLEDFIIKIKKKGFLVKLDSNGSNPELLGTLVSKKLIDYIAMDIKAPFEDYSKVTGVYVDEKKLKQSINIIINSGIGYEFRTTVVRGLLDANSIKKIGNQLHGSKRYFLQQFSFDTKMLDPSLHGTLPYTPEELQAMANSVTEDFDEVEVRGI